MERERINEIFLGLILVVLLIIMILSFTSVSAGNSKSAGNVINSYNTYSYGTDEQNKVYEVYHPKINYGYSDYSHHDYNSYYSGYNRHYISESSHSRYYGLFDNEVNEYSVKVKNNAHEGNYYSVKFYLTDYKGKTRTETVTHYLNPHESRVFTYKNVFNSDKEYNYWNYKVIQ